MLGRGPAAALSPVIGKLEAPDTRRIVMNTKALITTLAVLGSTSSLAMARPTTQSTAPAPPPARLSWTFAPPPPTSPPSPAPIVRVHRSTYVPAPVIVRSVEHRYGHDFDWTSNDGQG